MLHVTDQFRTNLLSLNPGGDTVILIHQDGRKLSYDKIKRTYAYMNKAFQDSNIRGAEYNNEYITNTNYNSTWNLLQK